MSDWWERFNLELNPLVKREPFREKNLFQNILIKTKIFADFEKYLKNPEKLLLNRIILICGEFGSGKTVLFDYIKFSLIKFEYILTKTLILGGPYQNSFEMKRDFINKLYYEITGQIKPIAGELSIIKILKEKTMVGLKGFVLILDELHRIPNHQVIFDFLKHLQGFYQQVQSNLMFTIIIVGREEWLDRLYRIKDYSGIIYENKKMPDLSVREALNLIHKRLVYYSKPKSKQKNENRITEKAMEKLFQTLNHRTPREILIKTNELFCNLPADRETLTQYDISHHVDRWTLNLIRKKIKSKFFKKLNNNLLDIKNKKPRTEFRDIIRIISELYQRTSILEDEWRDLSNQLNIASTIFTTISQLLLIKEVVIKKKHSIMRKIKHGAQYETEIYYSLREDIRNFFDDITKKYKLFPEDYLETIYYDEEEIKKGREIGSVSKQRDKIVVNLEDIVNELKRFKKVKKAIKHVHRVIENHKQIKKFINSGKTPLQPIDIFLNMRTAIIEILIAITIYRKNDEDIVIEEKVIFEDAIHWLGDEYGEWYPRTESIKIEGTEITKAIIEDLLEYYMIIIQEITNRFLLDLKQDGILTIPYGELTKEMQNDFLYIRDKISRNELEEAVNRLRTTYERFLRKFIKEELEYHLGKNWESAIPEQILKKCKKIEAKEMVLDNSVSSDKSNVLDFSFFLDLKKIIEENWDKFSGFFSTSTKHQRKDIESEKQVFLKELEDLNELRRLEAHSRNIGTGYRNKVTKATQNTLGRIHRIIFEKEKRYQGLDIIFNRNEIEIQQEPPNHVFVRAGPISGYISVELWDEFRNNEEIRIILTKKKPMTLSDFKKINLQNSREWKDVILCFAYAIHQGYTCREQNNCFIFEKP